MILIFMAVIPLLVYIEIYDIAINKFNASSYNYGSFVSRYADFEVALKMFIDHPIIGSGFGNLNIWWKYAEFIGGTGSNGLFFLIANTGIFSLLILIPIIFPSYIINFHRIDRLLISLTIFLLFLSENFTIILVFSILFSYGCAKNITITVSSILTHEKKIS